MEYRYVSRIRTRDITNPLSVCIESNDIKELWKKSYHIAKQACRWTDRIVSFRIVDRKNDNQYQYSRFTIQSELIPNNRHQYFRDMWYTK